MQDDLIVRCKEILLAPWTGERIAAPGAYDLPAELYHGDCCAGASLSSSGARQILETCPAKFWFESYLNPNRPSDDDSRFELGTAAHTALLEPASMTERIAVVDASDWRTKEAKEMRATFRAAGKTPILKHQAMAILEMREAVLAHPAAKRLWSDGRAEPTYIWRDPLTEVWLKARPDFVSADGRRVVDYKTTSRAEKDAFARRIYEHGYYQQGAWCLDGIEAATGQAPEEFILVAQEIEPPYLVSVFRLGRRALEWGRLLNRRAIQIFADCIATDVWPGYGDRAVELELPSFAEFALEARFDAGEFQVRRAS